MTSSPRRLTLVNPLVAEDLITTWFDEGSVVDPIDRDLSKAFDSVNHRLLLAKLMGYGIVPTVTNRVESFFSRQTFQVNVNGVLPQTAETISGTPKQAEC